jgi:hypothetical protein
MDEIQTKVVIVSNMGRYNLRYSNRLMLYSCMSAIIINIVARIYNSYIYKGDWLSFSFITFLIVSMGLFTLSGIVIILSYVANLTNIFRACKTLKTSFFYFICSIFFLFIGAFICGNILSNKYESIENTQHEK